MRGPSSEGRFANAALWQTTLSNGKGLLVNLPWKGRFPPLPFYASAPPSTLMGVPVMNEASPEE
ncbi:MAG: hypothetical protein QGI84_09420, partial [Dehalococcoidia bacterium]|nr:hypothetical protein [Dehalococcoidia bacterium]